MILNNESLDKRLEILATAVNHPIRALTYLSMEAGRIYSNGKELLESFLRCVGIPADEFYKEKGKFKDYIPIRNETYWDYVDDTIPGEGTLTRINLVTRLKIGLDKVGYVLTDFGIILKGFISYILKQFAKLGINPHDLFGSTKEAYEKRSPVIMVKMIEYLSNVKETTIGEIAEKLKIGVSTVYYHLHQLKKLGLIEYKSLNPLRGERIIYRVDLQRAEEVLNDINNNRIKIKRPLGKYTLEYILGYIIKNKMKKITTKDIEELGHSRKYSRDIVSFLEKLEVLKSEFSGGEKQSIIKPTEKLYEVYRRIMKPMIEVANDPDNIRKYSIYELNKKEKEELLKLYSEWKMYYGERKNIILSLLKNNRCLTIDQIFEKTGFNKMSIRPILTKLKKKGLIDYNKKDKIWCYKHKE